MTNLFYTEVDVSESTFWWLIAGSIVVLELLTGTFFLLMLALGMVAAALTAHAGGSITWQLIAASIVGGGTVTAWYHFKQRHSHTEPAAQANPNVNLDIGESVLITAWNPDGTANIQYRGANWTAIHRPGVSPSPGMHRVAELIGNRLLVDKT
jgi:membrane protein implicated in regulation of membrane protease activity